MLSTTEILKKELSRINEEQSTCITDSGYVLPSRRYEYQYLTKQARLMKDAIDQWEEWKRQGWRLS